MNFAQISNRNRNVYQGSFNALEFLLRNSRAPIDKPYREFSGFIPNLMMDQLLRLHDLGFTGDTIKQLKIEWNKNERFHTVIIDFKYKHHTEKKTRCVMTWRCITTELDYDALAF